MIGYYHTPWAVDADLIYCLREYGVYMLLGILFSTPVARKLGATLDNYEQFGKVKAVALPLSYGVLFLWAVSFLILGMHNPFIYFNF